VARERGRWSLPAAIAFLIGFLFIDLGYLGANLVTIPDGGWLPLSIGATLFVVMTTWRSGANLLAGQVAESASSALTFIGQVNGENIPRVPGCAIFFYPALGTDTPGTATFDAHHR
jgi:KUP system potassium uptake protein